MLTAGRHQDILLVGPRCFNHRQMCYQKTIKHKDVVVMIVAIIPAKGSSKRLPDKNMLPINDRPMIDFAIDDALASTRVEALYVSTDSEVIAAHARLRGLEVIRRPESLGGETPIIEVYRHALREIGRNEI